MDVVGLGNNVFKGSSQALCKHGMERGTFRHQKRSHAFVYRTAASPFPRHVITLDDLQRETSGSSWRTNPTTPTAYPSVWTARTWTGFESPLTWIRTTPSPISTPGSVSANEISSHAARTLSGSIQDVPPVHDRSAHGSVGTNAWPRHTLPSNVEHDRDGARSSKVAPGIPASGKVLLAPVARGWGNGNCSAACRSARPASRGVTVM